MTLQWQQQHLKTMKKFTTSSLSALVSMRTTRAGAAAVAAASVTTIAFHQHRCSYKKEEDGSILPYDVGKGISKRYISSLFSSFWSSSLSFSSTSTESSSSFNMNNKNKRLESIEDLAEQLSSYQNIIVVVGAGASVNAGIPDFRTPGTGLYDQLSKYNLPYPEAIFDLQYYSKHPNAFIKLAKEIWPDTGQQQQQQSSRVIIKPTLTHIFMKLLNDNNQLRRIYTQNIDGLESIVGIDDSKLVECHGNFRSAKCIHCGTSMNIEQCRNIIFQENSNSSNNNSNNIPICHKCGSYVKPDIVFFGEDLPMKFHQSIFHDVVACDLLLVIGSSLVVHPVASIPTWIKQQSNSNNKKFGFVVEGNDDEFEVVSMIPRVLLNNELVGDFELYDDDDDDDNSTTTNNSNNNDLVLIGDCDETVKDICRLAGWESKLQHAYEQQNKKKVN